MPARLRRLRFLEALFALLLLGIVPAHAQLKSDESAIIFTSAAWLDEIQDHWVLPIHGWVFELEPSVVRRAAVMQLLEAKFGVKVSPENEKYFNDRIQYLLADNERGKIFQVNIGSRDFATDPSAANGHFSAKAQFARAIFPPGQSPAWLTVRLLTGDSREVTGTIRLIQPEGVSVISDVDDTVKLSDVLNRAKLMENTFVKPFQAVPGMAELYRDWEARGAVLHFVSASPWQLYPALRDFFRDAKFPAAVLHLKSIRFTDATVLDLFKSNLEYKKSTIAALLARYPKHRVILVGDDGEQDPEAYAALLKNYPKQIQRVYIRSVTGKAASDPRFQALFQGVAAEKWKLFRDPRELDYL